MKIVRQSAKLINFPYTNEGGLLLALEKNARTCYQSGAKSDGTAGCAKKLLKKIYKRGHLGVFEHFSISGRFITNRGMTHELVRHRLAAYLQESTRYCNYGDKQIEFVLPVAFEKDSGFYGYSTQELYQDDFRAWERANRAAEDTYSKRVLAGVSPQFARDSLTIALKTEIVATMNVRQWWYVLGLRSSKAAHPQMRDLMGKWQAELVERMPFLFKEIMEKK